MVDMKGRVHTESWSDIKTLADVQKEQLNSGKKRALRRLTLFGKRTVFPICAFEVDTEQCSLL